MATRNLKQWLSYLEQLHPNEIDMGLARVQDAAQRLKLPRIANKIITVTGTNGKGSTCAFLASLVAQQGLTVGVYSSHTCCNITSVCVSTATMSVMSSCAKPLLRWSKRVGRPV